MFHKGKASVTNFFSRFFLVATKITSRTMATASAAPSDALLLLEGKEAKLVQRLLVDTFRYRVDGMSEKKLAAWAGQLEVQGDRMQEVSADITRRQQRDHV